MFAPISTPVLASRNHSSRSRAPMRMWWLHFGQTYRLRSSSARYSTASQAGHLIHRPSGTERVRRSVLMREGMIFSNHDMFGGEPLYEVPAMITAAGIPASAAGAGRPNSGG